VKADQRPGPLIGSLCSGYGGLDLGVLSVFGGTPAWHAEITPAAVSILEQHWPHVANLGDITAVDWHSVPAVCVMTAGFPCQDLSVAGLRAGLVEGTRSGLWHTIARAVEIIRPCLVVIENVRGILSAGADGAPADGELEPCPWCMGDAGGVPVLRAIGRVLGDLAAIGYDARWTCVRASDVGAPHQRQRIFLLAWPARPADTEGSRLAGAGSGARGPAVHRHHLAEDTDQQLGDQRRQPAPGQASPGRPRPESRGRGRAPAARTAPDDASRDGAGRVRAGTEPAADRAAAGGGLRAAEPAVADATGQRRNEGRPQSARLEGRPDAALGGGTAAADPAGLGQRDSRTASGPGLSSAAVAGGPSPVGDGAGRQRGAGPLGQNRWGPYAPAIARWEARTRPAPPPTDARGRLTPAFVEWVMGLEAGWVTAVPGLSRPAQLTALGNGVVPQQAAHALRQLTAGLHLACPHLSEIR